MTDEFFAALAHEVKTPLAVLRGYAELLANRDDEETRRTAPAVILEAAERLAPVVDDLLLVLEIESGTLRLDREQVAFRDLRLVGDARLLGRALDVLGGEHLSPRLDDGRVTLTADGARPTRLEVYLARWIAELHGGELRETEAGVTLTLPLAQI